MNIYEQISYIYSTYIKGKLLCVIQYKCNILGSLPPASINTNYTLLASSSSTSVKGTNSSMNTNVKAAIGTDATSGEK